MVKWSEDFSKTSAGRNKLLSKEDLATELLASGDPEIKEAWLECEQLRKAILKNNSMKKNIAKRLRQNERDADSFREELTDKVTFINFRSN